MFRKIQFWLYRRDTRKIAIVFWSTLTILAGIGMTFGGYSLITGGLWAVAFCLLAVGNYGYSRRLKSWGIALTWIAFIVSILQVVLRWW